MPAAGKLKRFLRQTVHTGGCGISTQNPGTGSIQGFPGGIGQDRRSDQFGGSNAGEPVKDEVNRWQATQGLPAILTQALPTVLSKLSF